MSLEQIPDFVVLRRLLRSIDPVFVLYTKTTLEAGQSELDIDAKSLIVSDFTPLEIAIPVVLFQIGQIRARAMRKEISSTSPDAMAEMLTARDRAASRWAFQMQMLFWPDSDPNSVQSVLSKLTMTRRQWLSQLHQSL